MEAPAEETVVAVHDSSHEPGSATTDKLSYEIFSILESKFLFGYSPTSQNFIGVPRSLSPLSSPPKPNRRKICVLSIDGAGLRSIIPAKVLTHLEASLQSISGNPHAKISDYFDLVAGSGSGGVLAGMLFKPDKTFRPDDAWRFLVDQAPLLFPKPKKLKSFFTKKNPLKAPTLGMERTMKEAFGEKASLRDTIKPVLIPCYDLNTSAPFVFSHADATESESFNFKLWEVGRATWAEPGRFEPAVVRSSNGSMTCLATSCHVMSNPCAVAITHVLNNKREFPSVNGVEDLLVLSLGCGCVESSRNSEVDIRKMKRWDTDKWAQPVARVVADGAAEFVDQSVSMAFTQCRSEGYVRIQGNCSGVGSFGSEVDYDPRPENINSLLEAGAEILRQKNVESVLFQGKRVGEKSNLEMIEWFAKELVQEHQNRGFCI